MNTSDLQSRMRSGFGKLGGRLAVICIAIGFLAIAFGYNGASSDPRIAAQFPYLISGGLVGIGLIVVGSAMIVIHAYREERMRLEAKLDELISVVARGGGVSRGSAAPAPRDLAGLVVAGSASYHTPGCRLVDGREEVDYLTPEEARSRSLQPCRVCQPAPSNVSVR
ncbi:MAG TPA: hypothetical protein VNA14_08960 [Mycobacteriales bacterium]|nr:hypothetical protein [Mycobacteriales bacterium]